MDFCVRGKGFYYLPAHQAAWVQIHTISPCPHPKAHRSNQWTVHTLHLYHRWGSRDYCPVCKGPLCQPAVQPWACRHSGSILSSSANTSVLCSRGGLPMSISKAACWTSILGMMSEARAVTGFAEMPQRLPNTHQWKREGIPWRRGKGTALVWADSLYKLLPPVQSH